MVDTRVRSAVRVELRERLGIVTDGAPEFVPEKRQRPEQHPNVPRDAAPEWTCPAEPPSGPGGASFTLRTVGRPSRFGFSTDPRPRTLTDKSRRRFLRPDRQQISPRS